MATTSPAPAVERTHPPDAVVRVVNPVMRRLLTSPLHRAVSGQLMLLRYRGRRSGRSFALPLGRQEHRGHVAAKLADAIRASGLSIVVFEPLRKASASPR